MSEFFNRQIVVLHQLIDGYRSGRLTLNALVQRIQAVGDVLEMDEWTEAISPIIWSMEQINAFALEAKKALTAEENESIKNSLLEIEFLISRLQDGEANV